MKRCSGLGAVATVCVLATGASLGWASPAERTITRAEARAVAMEISLRQRDLPSLVQRGSPGPVEANAGESACIGDAPPSAELASIGSASFVGPAAFYETVSSVTAILSSAALAARDLAAEQRPRALTCLRIYAARAERAGLPKDSKSTTTVAWLPTTLSRSDGIAAVQITVTARSPQHGVTVNVPEYVDLVAFAYGQAEVTLDVSQTFREPARSLVSQLAALLLARARTAIR
jgi:hypothetical protein